MKLGHIFFTAANAVLPIILLILLGYLLKRAGFLGKEFLKTGNKLVFKVCLPAMLFINVYDIDSFSSIHWDIVIYCVLSVFVIFLLGFVTAVVGTKVPERRGVILQCTFRSNTAIIGLSFAAMLGGEEAVAVAAIVSAFAIPVFNVLAVIALTIFVGKSDSEHHNVSNILLNIAKNPLIISVALGLVCLGIRGWQQQMFGGVKFALNGQLKFLYTALNNLKSVASPLALLVLGGQFEFSAVRGLFREIVIGTAWRTVIAPVLGIGGAILLSRCTGLLTCGTNEFPALIAMYGSPVAVSSAIMAGQMGNDEQLATQLVVWTSLCSIVTIFLTVCILMATGLLVI